MTGDVHFRSVVRERLGERLEIDNVVLGQRIRAHRLAAGLSLRDLASFVPISAQALNQYEHGRTRPRIDILAVLANVLGTRAEQLLRAPDEKWLGSVQIRQPRSGTRTDLKMAQAHLVAMTERSLMLEQKLGGGFPSPSLPVMEEIRLIRDHEDAEELAQDVRRRWGLGTGPLSTLVSLFEARGIRVFDFLNDQENLAFRGLSAFVWFSSGSSQSKIPAIIVNGALSGEEKRFVFCHELAHMILPNLLQQVLTVKVREKFANWFASSLLLPSSALRENLGRRRRSLSWYELGNVKRQFGINYNWILRRCRETGIISRDSYRNLFEHYRSRELEELFGGEDWALSPDEEMSTRLKRLAIRAVTEGVTTVQDATALLGVQQEELEALVGQSGDDRG